MLEIMFNINIEIAEISLRNIAINYLTLGELLRIGVVEPTKSCGNPRIVSTFAQTNIQLTTLVSRQLKKTMPRNTV